MVEITSLLLPLLISSVFVFIVSSIIHTVLPWHKSDYPKLANEEKVMDALRPLSIPQGEYMMPRSTDMSDTRSAEYAEKRKKGPVAMLTILPGGPISMTSNLVQWFAYSLIVGLFAAYVAGRALASGATYLQVFRFVGTTAFVGYSLALWQMTIWYNRSVSITLKSTIDGLLYAMITAGTFGWLWPR